MSTSAKFIVNRYLSDLEKLVTVKDQTRLRPKCCVRCFEVKQGGDLQKTNETDCSEIIELLMSTSQFPANCEKFIDELHGIYDFWKYNRKNHKKCMKNCYKSSAFLDLLNRHNCLLTQLNI